MNVELLRKVRAKILLDPETFNMDAFEYPRPICGSTRCIGGWAAHLSGNPISFAFHVPGTPDPGQIELGLTIEEADRLFYTSDWPAQFLPLGDEDGYVEAEDVTPEMAAARIDHFIQTEGRE